MRPSLDKIIFLLIFVKINVLESRAILNGCSCAQSVPFAVNIPVAPPPLEVPCATHGYKIEVPPPVLTAAKLSYALDVVVEAPLPVAPPPVCNPNLVVPIVKPALLAPDCDEPAVVPAPCGGCGVCAACGVPALPPPPPSPAPAPAPLPLALPPSILVLAPPPAALSVLPDDFSGVAPLTAPLAAPSVTYQIISTGPPAAPPAPLAPAYSLPLSPPIISASACGGCPPPQPDCRYVLKGIQSNQIYRGRSKRDVPTSQKLKCIDEIRDYVKSLKSTRVARKAKKSKLVKRDIKGEYDLLQREQSEMDLTIPEIIQYMPETMMPSFKRGKCNIGCRNCINNDLNKQLKKINSALPTEASNKENNKPTEQKQQQQPLNENTTELPNQHFDISSRRRSDGENYLKRSVNPFQSPPNPSYFGLLPPPYVSSTMELTKLAKNPGNPIWYQPQPLTDPNADYVYDRLGHKYKVKNGSFKLVTPSEQNDDDEVDRSTHVASGENSEKTTSDETKALESSAQNASGDEQMINVEAKKMPDPANQHRHAFNGEVNAPPSVDMNAQTMIQTPIVGAPAHQHHNPSNDPYMDKVIRDIVYQHPDFIDATQHAPGSLTLPEGVTRTETIGFLDKLIRGRLSKWFGAAPSEEVPMHSLQDLNRYARETGTSIKFIPIVTVDKNRLDEFRQTKSEGIS